MRSLFASFLLLAALPVQAHAQGVLHVLEGPAAGDLFGYAVAGAGDLDQDGVPDLLLGARAGHDATGVPTGLVRVTSGRTEAVLLTLFGASYADFFGFSVAGPGDVDQDGVPDLLVGAPQGDHQQFNNGTAELFSGSGGALLFTWGGLHPNTEFGHAVAGAGDLDQDGVPDLLVGTWRDHPNGTYSGAVFAFSGASGAQLHYLTGDEANDYVGWSVARIGDVDHDGVDDLATGCVHDGVLVPDAGAVRLYSGKTGALLWKVGGDQAGDFLGAAVAPAGDVDGDGVPDVAAGAALTASEGGLVRLLSGTTGQTIADVQGPAASRFGWALDRLGDLDGDGFDELVVGAPAAQSQAGRVSVLDTHALTEILAVVGPPGGNLGFAVARAGDLNGDLLPDVLAGAPFDDTAATDAGSAQVLSPVCGQAVSYGTACPGAFGTPVLTLEGCLTPGATAALRIENGQPSGLAFLLFGTGQNSQKLGPGCPLQIAPLLPPVLTLPLDAQGRLTLDAVLPVGVPSGTTFTTEALVSDPTRIGGYAASSGLLVTIL